MIISFSTFFQKKVNPHIDDFRGWVGKEVIVGLKGEDQYGNSSIGYISGIVAYQNLEDFSLGLYEGINEQTREGNSNWIMPLNIYTPISEVFFPAKVSESTNNSDVKKTSLTYLVMAEPNNPNSRVRNSFSFQSKRSS